MLSRRPNGRSRLDGSHKRTKSPGGFTLIELLVVIAIIALLLSILLPSLKRAKEAGKRALCLHRARSLAIAWTMYIEENDGRLPRGQITANEGWIRAMPPPYDFDPGAAPADMQLAALEQGELYPYLNTTKVFRCPVAKVNELRTYSTTHAMNGNATVATTYGGKALLKFSEIKNTGNRILFLDDYIFDWDACWMIYNNESKWWNTTPIRHGSGGNVFSFVDTHSEFWRWSDRRTIALAEKYYDLDDPDARNDPDALQLGNRDIERVQLAVWGELGY